MRAHEFLVEMPIQIDTLEDLKYGKFIIQIRTSGDGGQQEHYPAHIHVIFKGKDGRKEDIPVLIAAEPDYASPNSAKFQPKWVEKFIFNYVRYNVEALTKTFDAVMARKNDPVPADPDAIYKKFKR